MRLTDAEWNVMEVLWAGDRFSLKEISLALKDTKNWNKNTVYTYLTRMAGKGLVTIQHGTEKPYQAQVSREECAKAERSDLLGRVYGGAAGDLIAAFLKDSVMDQKEIARLKKLLDEMEV